MDSYEDDIARQPSGPFTNRQEIKTIRAVKEDWVTRRRYSEERNRRLKRFGGWILFGGPIVLVVIKLAEALLGKAGP